MLWVARNKTGGSTQEKVVCCRTLRLRAPKGSPNGLLSDRPTAGCTNRLRGTSRLPVCDGLLPALNHSKKKLGRSVCCLCVFCHCFNRVEEVAEKLGLKKKLRTRPWQMTLRAMGKGPPPKKKFKPQIRNRGQLRKFGELS